MSEKAKTPSSYIKDRKISSDEPDIHPIAFDYVLSWIYGSPFKIPQNDVEPHVMVTWVRETLNIALKLYLDDLISKVAAQLAEPFKTRYWDSKIAVSVCQIYHHLIQIEKPVPFTQEHLTEFVSRVQDKGHLRFLDACLKSIITIDGPDANAVFFRDMALAISAAWQDAEEMDKENGIIDLDDESDSIFVVDSPDRQSQTTDDTHIENL
ncbi:hypothetical protein ABW21_db0209650 [Orbilia brochopaga]|nr:hypothetical protein ABW21_db0209650 [Drechslerella brochopaga]